MTVQGQGSGTPDKQRVLSSFLTTNLNIAKHKADRYVHAELNAGSGYNDQIGVVGSPIIALDRMQHVFGMFYPWKLLCFEHDKSRAEKLEAMMPLANKVEVHRISNEDAFPILEREFEQPGFILGLIYADPNGYSKGIPWELLRRFAEKHPRIDLAFSLCLRQLVMEQACGKRNWPPERIPMSPRELPAFFGRRYGWVTKIQRSRYRRILLLIRNIELERGHKQLGIHRLSDPEGNAILEEYGR